MKTIYILQLVLHLNSIQRIKLLMSFLKFIQEIIVIIYVSRYNLTINFKYLKIQKIFKRIALVLNSYDNEVKFVTIEESLNEIVSQEYRDLGIYLIPKGASDKLKFKGRKSVKNLIEFYNKNVFICIFNIRLIFTIVKSFKLI